MPTLRTSWAVAAPHEATSTYTMAPMVICSLSMLLSLCVALIRTELRSTTRNGVDRLLRTISVRRQLHFQTRLLCPYDTWIFPLRALFCGSFRHAHEMVTSSCSIGLENA